MRKWLWVCVQLGVGGSALFQWKQVLGQSLVWCFLALSSENPLDLQSKQKLLKHPSSSYWDHGYHKILKCNHFITWSFNYNLANKPPILIKAVFWFWWWKHRQWTPIYSLGNKNMVKNNGNQNDMAIIQSIFDMFDSHRYHIITSPIEVFRFCSIRADLRGHQFSSGSINAALSRVTQLSTVVSPKNWQNWAASFWSSNPIVLTKSSSGSYTMIIN